jgi:hypothetical protein
MGLFAALFVHLLQDLPILITVGAIFWMYLELLLPNPRFHKFWAWLFMEFLEHILLPILVIISLFFFPALFLLILPLVVFFFFGFVFGKAKTGKDWLKVFILYVIIMFLFYLPTMITIIQVGYNIPGWIILIIILLTSFIWWLHAKKH